MSTNTHASTTATPVRGGGILIARGKDFSEDNELQEVALEGVVDGGVAEREVDQGLCKRPLLRDHGKGRAGRKGGSGNAINPGVHGPIKLRSVPNMYRGGPWKECHNPLAA